METDIEKNGGGVDYKNRYGMSSKCERGMTYCGADMRPMKNIYQRSM